MLTASALEWCADLWALCFLLIGFADEIASDRGVGLMVRSWAR